MANVILHPQSGSLQNSTSVSFNISGIRIDGYRLRVENATNRVEADVKDYLQVGDKCSGTIDLKIPENSSDSVFSIFFVFEAPDGDGWKVRDILPSIYSLTEQSIPFKGTLNISPLFASPSEVCAIKVNSKPLSKTIFSVNDRRIAVHTNKDGDGSIHFRVSEVMVSSPSKSVVRYPVYYYDDTDNFTKKKFSGSYLNILPSSISTHASIDPRCDPDDEAYIEPGSIWEAPAECTTEPVVPTGGPSGPTSPPVCIPNSCKEGDLSLLYACAIHSHSIALLNNGMVAHAYLSVDSSITDRENPLFNINQIKVKFSESSIDKRIITTQNVVIAPKASEENFQIYVNESLFNLMAMVDDVSNSDVKVMFYNETLGYQCLYIIGRTIDEYHDKFVLIAQPGDTTISLDGMLFCVNAVFFHEQEDPIAFSTDSLTLSQPADEDNNNLQVLNIRVASNSEYIGEENEFYLYFIAEVMINGQNQLLFYSTKYDKNGSSDIAGWYQLTSSGNNRNPKIVCDNTNTLHVFWESDRSGSNQIYYGVLGASAVSNAVMALSSVIDKYAEFYEKDDKAFEYIEAHPLVVGGSNIPEYATSQLVSSDWILQKDTDVSIMQTDSGNHLTDLQISYGNIIDNDAMAFSRLQIQSDIDNPSDTTENPYLQYNYQIAFDFSIDIFQTSHLMDSWDGVSLTERDIDALFNTWKSSFTSSVEEEATNVPVYIKEGNKFTLGRQDGVFDRIIPIFGSYNANELLDNPSWNEFQIKITKLDSNLKDYVFGLMVEKSIFRATNIQSISDFASTNESSAFVDGEEQVILTGRAKFIVLVKTEDIRDTVSNYFIVREFPEIVDITSPVNITAIAGYSKISSEEVRNALDSYEGSYISRFAGILTLMIDGIAKFSHGFISTLSDEYNYFDIGFGVPHGGYYAADKMLPSKLTIFDNLQANLYFSNIEITSPTYTHNSSIIHLPDTIKQFDKLKVLSEDPIVNPSGTDDYWVSDLLSLGFRGEEQLIFTDDLSSIDHPLEYDRVYEVEGIDRLTTIFSPGSIADQLVVMDDGSNILYDTGDITSETSITYDVDISSCSTIRVIIYPSADSASWALSLEFKKVYSGNTFVQLPLTFEGINQSVNIEKGLYNDIHIAWESNRSRYWDVYYSHSIDRLRPYRFNTQITSTESNSIMPDLAVARNGKRMIIWHDDREGKFNIYAARSLEGYTCEEEYCKNKMAEAFGHFISECSLYEVFEAETAGSYHFQFELYTDNGLKNLYKTVTSSDNVSGWFIDGVELEEDGVSVEEGQSVTVTYTPNNQDGIFDKVLYIKLVAISG